MNKLQKFFRFTNNVKAFTGVDHQTACKWAVELMNQGLIEDDI